jgi:hypothetical protein
VDSNTAWALGYLLLLGLAVVPLLVQLTRGVVRGSQFIVRAARDDATRSSILGRAASVALALPTVAIAVVILAATAGSWEGVPTLVLGLVLMVAGWIWSILPYIGIGLLVVLAMKILAIMIAQEIRR